MNKYGVRTGLVYVIYGFFNTMCAAANERTVDKVIIFSGIYAESFRWEFLPAMGLDSKTWRAPTHSDSEQDKVRTHRRRGALYYYQVLTKVGAGELYIYVDIYAYIDISPRSLL